MNLPSSGEKERVSCERREGESKERMNVLGKKKAVELPEVADDSVVIEECLRHARWGRGGANTGVH